MISHIVKHTCYDTTEAARGIHSAFAYHRREVTDHPWRINKQWPTLTGQTTVNKYKKEKKKRSADSLYNPYKCHGPQTPLKMFEKIHTHTHTRTHTHTHIQIHDKAVQSNILWLNLNKIRDISILQSAHKQGNDSFHFHAPGSKRRYPCTQTASVVPKYFPCLLQFCTGYRIWHASRVRKRKTSENVDLHTAKNIQVLQPTLFRYF